MHRDHGRAPWAARRDVGDVQQAGSPGSERNRHPDRDAERGCRRPDPHHLEAGRKGDGLAQRLRARRQDSILIVVIRQGGQPAQQVQRIALVAGFSLADHVRVKRDPHVRPDLTAASSARSTEAANRSQEKSRALMRPFAASSARRDASPATAVSPAAIDGGSSGSTSWTAPSPWRMRRVRILRWSPAI